MSKGCGRPGRGLGDVYSFWQKRAVKEGRGDVTLCCTLWQIQVRHRKGQRPDNFLDGPGGRVKIGQLWPAEPTLVLSFLAENGTGSAKSSVCSAEEKVERRCTGNLWTIPEAGRPRRHAASQLQSPGLAARVSQTQPNCSSHSSPASSPHLGDAAVRMESCRYLELAPKGPIKAWTWTS